MAEIRLIDANALKEALHNFFDGKVINEPAYILRDVFCHIDNTQTIELTEEQAIDKLHETGWLIRHDKEMTDRPQGECRTCIHRDPEDKKCDCGKLERQGCIFPVSDDYYCKYYERGDKE